MSCCRVFSNQGNIVAVGKARNYKGRKNPRLTQRYYFLTIYGQLKPFSRGNRSIAYEEKLYLKNTIEFEPSFFWIPWMYPFS